MDSAKGSRRNSQANMDLDEPEETNDNGLLEQQKSVKKIVKIQNGMVSSDILKLNNNIGEGEAKFLPQGKPTVVILNGAGSARTENSEGRSEEKVEISRIQRADEAPSISNGAPEVPEVQNQLSTDPNSCVIINGSSNSSQLSASTSYSESKSANVSSLESEKIFDSDIRNNVDYTFGIEKCPAKVSCSKESSSDVGNYSNSYTSEISMNNIGARIGSTSHGTCCYLRPNINGCREDGEGPSGTQRRDEADRRDSSSGNEGDLSDVEDYCIYTYKGNDDAVEPLNARQPMNPGNEDELVAAGQPNSGRSSPEMDFLEMDFDPGPSCEQDTGDSDLASINEDIQNLTLDNVDSDPLLLNDLSGGKVAVSRQQSVVTPEVTVTKQREHNVSNYEDQRDNEIASTSNRPTNCTSPDSQCMPSTSAGLRKWEATSLNRSIGCPLRESYSYHNTSGDLISPGENRDTEAELWAENCSVSVPESANFNTRKNNLSSTLYHRMMAKKLMLNKQTTFSQSGDSNLENELCNARLGGSIVEKVMLWSEQEATIKQVTQIGTSACGATSAINALLALDVPFSLEVLVKGVATRLREPGTPLPRYLVSRSLAGATHKDVIRGISLATNGAVITKFFPFYPERNVSLSHWLHYWISRGAAPIATLNLQNCATGSNIPDAWHYQMIFGVSQSGIYMTNPLECLPEQLVWHQLVSPSILLIKRADVLAHWNPSTDLTPLIRLDQRWRKLNVLGQVVNMIRETMSERKRPANSTIGASHLRIPASFQAGITLVMRTDAPAAEELLHTEQLPLL
ncbi:uncharacterized protein [Venturia canescens]|uniref:uncharacterized protein n=1 Tax=Venturia canescens TaxID=32260 RepID=UPI001C9C3AD1|nr:uncharacterized protein LOC122414314 [Venturia canescens]